MAFRTAKEAMETAQPGDRVVQSGDYFLVESPAPSSLVRGPLDSFWESVGAPSKVPTVSRTADDTRSTASQDISRPMTRGERAAEDVLEAKESGRRPGLIKSAFAFLHRRGIIR